MFSVIVIINQWLPYYKNIKFPIYSGELNDCRNYIINVVSDNFKKLDIDFPLNLDDFEYIWFDSNRTDANSFTYILIPNNNNNISYGWDEPWSLEDLYDDILENMYQYEINNISTNIEDESDIV